MKQLSKILSDISFFGGARTSLRQRLRSGTALLPAFMKLKTGREDCPQSSEICIRSIVGQSLMRHYLFRGSLLSLLLTLQPLSSGSERKEGILLSSTGSGRATAYLESPKIITFEGRAHVAWLDSPEEGFRIRIRTMDRSTSEWSETWTIGEAQDNHGGPALTVDEAGYLHVLYYSHHHPFRYRRSLRPNDASEWTPFQEFGHNLTYPALLCARDGTLVMTARRSYDDRPWELEMWTKAPGEAWKRQHSLLRSRYGDYAQFAASLAWSADHTTLHLSARIYELPEGDPNAPYTTVGYLFSEDGGETWMSSDRKTLALPATPESFDTIASGRAKEGRVLNAGSMAVGPDGLPYVPYSVRTQDTSQAYLAKPLGDGKWRHIHLNPFLPTELRDWDLFMHSGVSFGSTGQMTVAATVMQVAVDGIDWGEVSTEVVRFRSKDGGRSFVADMFGEADPNAPRWMPNLERPTGFNEMPEEPGLIYTHGVRGAALTDQLSNEVWWAPETRGP